ncbi:MAG: sodium:proton antiporter [Armatimonadaceae bacterium]
MQELNIALVAIGGLVLVLGIISRPLRGSFLTRPLLALGLGVLLGPVGLDWLDPHHWGKQETILEQVARLTLAIGLMGVALRLPPLYPLKQWRPLVILLLPGMLLMCFSTALLAAGILGLPLLSALLLGAVASPTDPIVASSVVTGSVAQRNLPEYLRHMLSVESGTNDGLAYPLVLLPILLLAHPTAEAWTEWGLRVLLWEVGAAVGVGIAIGWAAGRLLDWAEAKKSIEEHSFLAFTVALSLLTLGAAKLQGTDGILAVFAAGSAFDGIVGGKERSEEENIQEAVNQFFTLPIFALFGLALPWDKWQELGWSGIGFVAAVLLLRRLPALLLLRPLLHPMDKTRDILFAGWFGPIGVAALFYAMLAMRRTGEEIYWTVGSLLIFSSLIVHGVTATVFTRLYGSAAPDKPDSKEDT